jgi:cysteinyl-tRNA synthetase
VDDVAGLGVAPGALPDAFTGFAARFTAAMDDDFNTPQALGVLFDFARALSDHRDRGLTTAAARAGFAAGVAELLRLARVLGLLQRSVDASGPSPAIERLVAERTAARANRDWKRSDELRAEIQRLGWAVEDTPSGPRLTRSAG